jgi:hypothetical protein
MNTNIYRHATNAGIRFDSFGSPVVDKESMLEDFLARVLTELSHELDPVIAEEVVAMVKYRYNITI